MARLFTIAAKGEFNGQKWNGNNSDCFFKTLHREGVRKLWDVRRYPNQQFYRAFNSRELNESCKDEGIEYTHYVALAPQPKTFRSCIDEQWGLDRYAVEYFTEDVIRELNKLTLDDINHTAVMCAEQPLFRCHRGLIAMYLKEKFQDDVEIIHLGLKYDECGREVDRVPYANAFYTREYIRKLIAE